mgnify:CR=1 FL=1
MIELPSSLVLKYDNTNYRIFLTFDDVCFKCKLVGHYANDCPKVVESISPVHSKPVDTLAGKRQTTDDDTSMLNPLDLLNNTGDSDSKSKKLKVILLRV